MAARRRLAAGSLDRDAAALRHRVARVGGEVDEDLIELTAIHVHDRATSAGAKGELDLLAEDLAEDHVRVRDHAIELDVRRPANLPSPEREQLSRELRRALRRLPDLLDLLVHGAR